MRLRKVELSAQKRQTRDEPQGARPRAGLARLPLGALWESTSPRSSTHQLAAELAELEGPRRAEIVEAIAVARGHGDLSENFEYHAAKNEQGLLERKITILRARLEDAEIVEARRRRRRLGRLDGRDRGRRRRAAWRSRSPASAAPGRRSPSSPLGTALLGKRVGETVDVQAPKSTWQATVVSIASSG